MSVATRGWVALSGCCNPKSNWLTNFKKICAEMLAHLGLVINYRGGGAGGNEKLDAKILLPPP